MKYSLEKIYNDVADSDLSPIAKAFIFLRLEGFEKELREQEKMLCPSKHDVCCPLCLEKGELMKIEEILG